MKNIIVAAFLIFTLQSALLAQSLFEGDVYLQGTNKGVLLFKHRNSITQKGDELILQHIYTKVDGGLAALEEVVYVKGKLANYKVEMPDTKCGCKLVHRSDGKLVFSFTAMGKDGDKEADYTGGIVTGPTLRDFIESNWKILMAGKTAYFKLPAMNLQKIAEFQLKRETKSQYAKEGTVVFRMKIANVFLRLFVDPVDLVYDIGKKQMIEIHGKSLLQRKVGGKIENPVVDIYYTYK